MATGTKRLAGEEDILFGQGAEDQDRAGINYSINKVNAESIPFTGSVETGDKVSVKNIIDQILTSTTIEVVTEW